MKAIILAAGRGSRMGSLTSDRPKALLEIAGRTLLDRQLTALREASISQIAVCTGWHAELFQGLGLRLFHNPRWATTSMADSLACARDWLTQGTTIVSYGDIVFSHETVTALASHPAPIALAYDPDWLSQWTNRFVTPLSDAETFQIRHDGMVCEIGNTAQTVEEVEGQYVGLLKLEPRGWAEISSRLETASTRQSKRDVTTILGQLVAAGSTSVYAVAIRGPWHEFDSSHDITVGMPAVNELDRLLFAARRTGGNHDQ